MSESTHSTYLSGERKTALLSYLLFCAFLITGYFNALIWLVLLFPVILLHIRDWRSGGMFSDRFGFNAADAAILLICLMEVVLVFFSKFRPNSIIVVQRVLLFCVFWFFSRVFIVYRQEIKSIVKAVSLFGGFIGLTTLIFFFVHKHHWNMLGITDLVGYRQYYHPWWHISNDWVAVLLCLLPFPLKVLSESAGIRRAILHLVSFSLLLMALMVSFSRGAYLSVSVFLLFTFVFTFFSDRGGMKRLIRICGMALMLSAPVMLCEMKPILTTLSINGTTVQKRSIEGRYKKWDEAVEIFRMAPVTGVGAGNYGPVSDNFIQDKNTNLTNRSTNTYLQILAEKGAAGASLSFIVLVLITAGIVKRSGNGCYGTVFIASLISVAVREFFFSSFYPFPRVPFFCILILFLIIQPVRENEKFEMSGEE